jgi:ESCRT-I complex subunit VPS28
MNIPEGDSMDRYSSDGFHGETVELFETSKERQKYDDEATLYAVIVATEHLERAFARDAVSDKEYTALCNKLISQFRLAEKAVCGSDMTTE